MSVYNVAVVNVTDNDRYMSEFAPRALQIVKKHGGEVVFISDKVEPIAESLPANRIVVIRHPDAQAAHLSWVEIERELGEVLDECAALNGYIAIPGDAAEAATGTAETEAA